MVLLSKQLVTIDCNVAVDFEPDKMQAQPPDAEAARALFTEMEFNTLTKEFITESVELGETEYRDAESAADVEAVLAAVRQTPDGMLAIALESAGERVEESTESEVDEEPDRQMMLTAAAEKTAEPSHLRLAISAKQGAALSVRLDDSPAGKVMKEALANPAVPKAIHDSKAAMHAARTMRHRARWSTRRFPALRLPAGSDLHPLQPL